METTKGMGRTENFLRKLHSLSGLIPIGVFLTVHTLVNSSAIWGEEAYNVAAGVMVNLPYKLFLETFVIFVPLLFHGILGIWIALKAKNNVRQYTYARNWGFFLQRLTGFVMFAFLVWHVWQTRVQAEFGVEPGFSMMADIVANPVFLALYIVGIVASMFHFANGIWTFLITWGITVTPKSQKVSKYATMGIFVVLSVIGVLAILAFA